MSDFPSDLLALARALARVHSTAPHLTEAGAMVALQARSTSLHLVAQMVGSLGVDTYPSIAPHGRRTRRIKALRLLASVPTAPLRSMGGLARIEAGLGFSESRTTDISLTSLRVVPPTTPYEEAWRQVLLGATVTNGSFQSLPHRLDRAPVSSWTVAREAAAIAGAVASLDERLLPACRRVLPDLDLGGSVAASHLRPAAAAVSRSAQSGSLPTMEAVVASAGTQAIRVANGRDLITAMDRLPRLIQEDPQPQVSDLRLVSVAVALGLDLASQVIDAPGSEQAARLAAALHQVSHGDPQVRRVSPGDADAPSELTTQVSSMVTFLARARRDLQQRPQVAHAMAATFSAFVDFSPSCVHASLSRVRQLLRAAQWATTVGGCDVPVQRFQPVEPRPRTTDRGPAATGQPRLLAALAEADAVAGRGRSPVLAPRATPNSEVGVSAADVLTQLNQDESRPATALALDTFNSLAAAATSPRQLETFIERAVQIDEPQTQQPVPPLDHHHTAGLSMPTHAVGAGVGLH